MSTLLEALALTEAEVPEGAEGAVAAYTVTLTQDWTQGRTQFGGLLAGMAASAATRAAGPERPVRTLDVAFVGPLATGTADLVVKELGRGKAVTQLSVEIRQDGVLATLVHVVAGAARVSPLRVPGPGPRHLTAELADPEQAGIEMPYLEGVMPVFTQHTALRWCSPSFPFTGAPPEDAHLAGWIRWRDEKGEELDDATRLAVVVASMDAWPPTVLPITTGPTPVSTIRWAVHLLAPVPADIATAWFWYEAETLHHGEGYATTTDTLWAGQTPIAWSEQLVGVYDKPAPA